MNRHSKEFPDIDVPEHFHSNIFHDTSWKADDLPSFVFKDSVLDDEHSLKVWIDNEDPEPRKLGISEGSIVITKRFTVVRQSGIFVPQIIYESDDLNEFFHWALQSLHFEMALLARMKIIFRACHEIGLLNQLPNPVKLHVQEELFQLIHHKNVFVLIKSDGYIELREFVNGEDREVDRNYRNTNLIEVLHKVDRCKDCGKMLFENECEECNESN